MPRLPRTSVRKIVRTLEGMGFAVLRQHGSHIILRRGSHGCVVPNHKEVAVGTLRGALKQAGVTAEDFLKYFME